MTKGHNSKLAPRTKRLATAALAALLLASTSVSAQTFSPDAFFSMLTPGGKEPANVEADYLSYDPSSGAITAEGAVELKYQGLRASGESLRYNMKTGELRFIGAVTLKDRSGFEIGADSVEVTGGMKEAYIRSLALITPGGSTISAATVEAGQGVPTVLTDAAYSPCGDCIDEKGRRIGWRVRAAKVIYDPENGSVYVEQPRLELLGVSVAWLPFLSLPDPTQPRRTGFRIPDVGYTEKAGLMVTVPYFWAVGEDTDVLFTPTLLSQLGVKLGAELTHRFESTDLRVKVSGAYRWEPELERKAVNRNWVLMEGGVTHRFDLGEASVKVSAVYQPQYEQYQKATDREWRGAIQTAGEFEPVENWTTGWSYTAFTDPAYLKDYKLKDSKSAVNEVYATHFDPESFYADVRVQEFNVLGNVTQAKQDREAIAIPNARASKVIDLADGWGQARLEGWLLGVERACNDTARPGGVQYVFGYEERKVHGTALASWQNQWVGPAGVLFTPYLGIRGDAASYDGASELKPDAATLYSLTPIAAMDVRWPLAIRNGTSTQIVEPIGQLVFRGSDETLVGITNDNAQSFVFDDSNLFSYNRFTGTDRQETGLRANLGVRYQLNFDESWLELLAGQSFHLAGENAFDTIDGAQVGNGSGLDGEESYVVLGARGSLYGMVDGAAKLQIDPEDLRVTRAGFGVDFENEEGYTLSTDYIYLAANADRGVTKDQHEVVAVGTIPLFDYWKVKVGGAWDLASNSWLEATGGLQYDDGYLQFGADVPRTRPTHKKPDDTRFTTTFKLKSAEGTFLSF